MKKVGFKQLIEQSKKNSQENRLMNLSHLKRYVILSASPLSIVDGEVPEEILVFPYGKTEFTKDGKTDFYVFSESDADTLIAEFARKGVDILLDYEHQMLRSAFNGKEVPAAGWGKNLIKKPDGLWALVSWSPKARGYLENGEYKYISPVFRASRTGKNITSLFNISLTGKPATDNQPALIAADDYTAGFGGEYINNQPKGNGNMDKLLKMLGLTSLSDSEDQAAIESGIEGAVQELLDGKKATEDFLALHDAESLNVVTAKINQMVPAEEKIELENKIKKKEAEDAVALVLSDGKITEAQKEDALDFALNDLELFNKFYKKAPKVVPDNKDVDGLDTSKKDESREHALSDAVSNKDLAGTIANAPVTD